MTQQSRKESKLDEILTKFGHYVDGHFENVLDQEEARTAILELVRECVPKGMSLFEEGGNGWNCCRAKTLENLEKL